MIPQPFHSKSATWPWGEPQAQSRKLQTGLPRITVITPSFNQSSYLEETLRSVLLQNYENLEYIVVDGGSTDGSERILNHYASSLQHCLQEPDRGQSDALCKGLRLATGDIFGWINSDDRLEPGILHEVARQFTSNIDLYAVQVMAQTDNSTYLMRNENLSACGILRDDRYRFSQPGLWFRRAHVEACGGIDDRLNYAFDWDLLIRYLHQYPRVRYSPSVGAMFRVHAEAKTMTEASKDASANRFLQESERIRNKLENLGSPRLRRASLLGRRREPWHRRLIAWLDQPNISPLALSKEILIEASRDPGARFSTRTFGSLARVLSRYIRRKKLKHHEKKIVGAGSR
jgi:glycosyltransferase involved in cell wall biosynthesis